MTKLVFLPWVEAVERVGREWSDLTRRCQSNPSLDPRWMDAVLRSHGKVDSATVAAAYEGDDLVGILPFLCGRERVHGVPLNTVDFCSNLVSYHAEIVSSAAHSGLLLAALEFAHKGNWHLLRMNNVPEDSVTVDVMSSVAGACGAHLVERPGELSPFITVQGSWEQFLTTRSKKFRANVTRAIRRMKEQGETAMRWYGPGDDTIELLRCMTHIEERSWKSRAGSAITDRPVESDYYRRVLPVLSDMGVLFANVLFIKDTPAAYVLCASCDGWIGQLKTSFDKDLTDAGARVIDESVRRAFERGARVYDFLGDASAHKLKWTDQIRRHRGYWLFSSSTLARTAWLIDKILVSARSRKERIDDTGSTEKMADS